MKWQTSAPSNIALIKYMGKHSNQLNLPANASLSYTLEHLRSFVELEEASVDAWQPLQSHQSSYTPVLTPAAEQRYLEHLQFIKKRFNYSGHFKVCSTNNFPADCGIASSASSFAALTLCAVTALTELTQCKPLTTAEIAELSRYGSGSSCRSFMGPWALWQENTVEKIELPYIQLNHAVVVVSEHYKEVSSSAAHQRVLSSALYPERAARAEGRLAELLKAFAREEWPTIYKIVWQEFFDMHALFETAGEPFGYMQPESLEVLNYLRRHWEQKGDGPVITMDAGPNIHLLWRLEQADAAEAVKRELAKKFSII